MYYKDLMEKWKKNLKKYWKIPQGGHIMVLLLFHFISLPPLKGIFLNATFIVISALAKIT